MEVEVEVEMKKENIILLLEAEQKRTTKKTNTICIESAEIENSSERSFEKVHTK